MVCINVLNPCFAPKYGRNFLFEKNYYKKAKRLFLGNIKKGNLYYAKAKECFFCKVNGSCGGYLLFVENLMIIAEGGIGLRLNKNTFLNIMRLICTI